MGNMPTIDAGLKLSELRELLLRLGEKLNFDVRKEVEASESAWVDLVWFDKRLPVREKSSNMRHEPVLPVVAFEIEWGTGLNAKHVKGSVSNLNNLGAQLGVIVVAQHNIAALSKQPAHTQSDQDDLEKVLRDRVYRWVYAESRAQGRIIVMSENEVIRWSATNGCAVQLSSETQISPSAGLDRAEPL